MKIVHIVPNIETGGAEKFCIDMCNTLSKENDVTMIVLDKIQQNETLLPQIEDSVNLVSMNKEGKSPKTFYNLYCTLKEINPDVIHTHTRAQVYASIGIIALKKPNIHTVHNLAPKEATSSKVRKYYDFLYKKFNFTPVSISDEVLISVKKEYGQTHENKIDNGAKALIKTDKFDETSQYIQSLKEDENTKIFVSIGRLMEQKNHLMMIEAFETLFVKGLNAKLLIIGSKKTDSAYAQRCQDSIKSHDKIFLLGEKPNIPDFIYNCDAMCLSSIYEGMPISILETMSAGVPTISTPVGGVVDIIDDGVNGYLSKEVNVHSYVKALKRFLEHPTHDKIKTKQIFDDNYSIETTAKNYMELYKKVSS